MGVKQGRTGLDLEILKCFVFRKANGPPKNNAQDRPDGKERDREREHFNPAAQGVPLASFYRRPPSRALCLLHRQQPSPTARGMLL